MARGYHMGGNSIELPTRELIPLMIDNTHPSGVASATGLYSTYQPYLAFYRNLNTAVGFDSNTNCTITYKFDSPVRARKGFSIKTGNAFSGSTYTVEASTDGSNYTTIGTYVEDTVSDTVFHEFDFGADYQWYRWSFRTGAAGGSITELQLYK